MKTLGKIVAAIALCAGIGLVIVATEGSLWAIVLMCIVGSVVWHACQPATHVFCPYCLGKIPRRAVTCMHCCKDMPEEIVSARNAPREPMVQVECPACGRAGAVAKYLTGVGVKCAHCGQGFVPEVKS